MLVLAIVLIVVGALVAYLGRPREQLIYIGGVIIFAVGVILLIVWAVQLSGADSDVDADALIGGPALLALLRRRR